jgi:hypothetical protein
MAKLTLNSHASLANETTFLTELNENFTDIIAQIDLLVSRDGESPNTMTASLDMNSQRVLNILDAATAQEPASKAQLDASVAGDLGVPDSATAAALADVSDAINTAGKTVRKLVWDTTNDKPYWASGTAAADPWYDATGTGVTPS